MNIPKWARRLVGGETVAKAPERSRVIMSEDPDRDPAYRAISQQATELPWSTHRRMLERIYVLARTNPMAHRGISLVTDFVVGAGVTVSGSAWVKEFWTDRRNRMAEAAFDWCNELTRSGELFIALTRAPNGAGMSYARIIPAIMIDEIETADDDISTEYRYHQVTSSPEGRWWPAYHAGAWEGGDHVMLHYAINRAAGHTRGISDLWSIASWLERYDLWLEDRVRINRYKGAYLWQVTIGDAMPGQLEAKRAQYSRVPPSGSIIVTDGGEEWKAVQPDIGADDVQADGRALRLMIAVGLGIPLHFLSEGESATRATAREMNQPTYKHFAHRQYVFELILRESIVAAAQLAGRRSPTVDIEFESVLSLDIEAEETKRAPDSTPGTNGGEQNGR